MFEDNRRALRGVVIGLLVAVGLILLAGVAVVPNLINPEDYRTDIAAGVETLTGREVQIDGKIGLSLLPRPTLSVAQASLAGGPDALEPFQLAIERLDLRLAPLPLLRGELEVVEVLLVRPVLTLARPPERPLSLLSPAIGERDPALPAVRLERVMVADGMVIVTGDADGGVERRLDQLNLDLSGESATGPFVLTGDVRDGDRSFSLAAELGRLDPRRSGGLRLELSGYGADGSRVTASYRGLARLGGARPELSGELTIEGADLVGSAHLLTPLVHGIAPELADGERWAAPPDRLGEPFTLIGRLELSSATLAIERLALRLGGAGEASGHLRLALGAEPQLDLELRASELDLPELSPATLAAGAWPAPPPRLQGAITITVSTLSVQDAAIRRLRLGLSLPGDGRIAVDRAAALLPGGTDIGFSGILGTTDDGATPLLSGALEAATDNLRTLVDWLGFDTAAVPQGRLRTMSFTGDVTLTPLLLKLAHSELRVDASTLTGSMALGLGPRRQLAMAVSLDRLNADAYFPEPADSPDEPAGEAIPWLPEDWHAAALALDAAVDLRVERLTWGDQRLQDLHLRSRLEEGLITIDELVVAELAELSLRLSGAADLNHESVDLSFEVATDSPVRALRLLGYDPPLALAGFAPVHLDGTAIGPVSATEIELDISAGGLSLDLSGEAALRRLPTVNVAWQAAYPDLVDLLYQLGVPEVPQRALAGPVQLAGSLDLRPDEALAARFAGTLGPMAADGTLAWEEREPRPHLSLTLGAEPLVTELVTVVAAAITPGRRNPFTPGNLSRQRLDVDALAALDLELDLATDDLRYGGQSIGPLSLSATLEDRRLDLRRLSARPFGGTLGARALLVGAEDGPLELALDISLDGVEAGSVLELVDVRPALRGPADIRLTATTAGRSAADLVGNLNGELEVRVRRGRLAGVDYGPVRQVLDENGPERPNMARMRQNLLTGETPFTVFGGILSLERGVLHAAELGGMLDGGGMATLEGLIDLPFWATDLTLELHHDRLAEDGLPAVGLRIVGPLARPQVVPRLDELDAHLSAAAGQPDAEAQETGSTPAEPGAAPDEQPVVPAQADDAAPQGLDGPLRLPALEPPESVAPPDN